MSAAEQLCLLDAIADAEPAADEVDLVDSVLHACGGDARLAIRELLADADLGPVAHRGDDYEQGHGERLAAEI